MEELKWLTSLGVGGVLAGAIFVFYRRDFLRERRQNGRREQEKDFQVGKLLEVLERNTRAWEKNDAATNKLAGAVDTLSEAVRRMETLQVLQMQKQS